MKMKRKVWEIEVNNGRRAGERVAVVATQEEARRFLNYLNDYDFLRETVGGWAGCSDTQYRLSARKAYRGEKIGLTMFQKACMETYEVRGYYSWEQQASYKVVDGQAVKID